MFCIRATGLELSTMGFLCRDNNSFSARDSCLGCCGFFESLFIHLGAASSLFEHGTLQLGFVFLGLSNEKMEVVSMQSLMNLEDHLPHKFGKSLYTFVLFQAFLLQVLGKS